MTFKKITGKLHLWLGLVSGIVVFIVSLTGAILVFEHEIKSLVPENRGHNSHQDNRNIEVQPKSLLKPSELKRIFENKHPGIEISGVNYHKGYSSLVWAWKDGDDGYDHSILVDPYSGEIVRTAKEFDAEHNEELERMRGVDVFFALVLQGHLYLWLPEDIGKIVVDYCTLIFLIMLVSGIILWWPRNKAAARQRFRFKWKPSTLWRRKNYDLHNVLGFYMSWIAVFITITGLVMAFEWFSAGWYFLLSGGHSREIQVVASGTINNPVDILWERFYEQYPDHDGWLEIYFPEEEGEAIMFRIDPFPGRKKAEYHSYSPYTLEEVGADSPLAYSVVAANYDIHVGAVFGLPTKILAFGASLIAASLPVTGFAIWWGRGRKSKPATRITE